MSNYFAVMTTSTRWAGMNSKIHQQISVYKVIDLLVEKEGGSNTEDLVMIDDFVVIQCNQSSFQNDWDMIGRGIQWFENDFSHY